MNYPCGGPLTTGCRRRDAPRARCAAAHGGAAPALLTGSPESEFPRQCAIDLLDREERSGLHPDHSGAHAGEGHGGRAFRVGEIDDGDAVALTHGVIESLEFAVEAGDELLHCLLASGAFVLLQTAYAFGRVGRFEEEFGHGVLLSA